MDNLPTWGTAPGAPGPAVSPPTPRFPASPGRAERALPTPGDGFPKPRRELPEPSSGDPRRTRHRRPTGADTALPPKGKMLQANASDIRVEKSSHLLSVMPGLQ